MSVENNGMGASSTANASMVNAPDILDWDDQGRSLPSGAYYVRMEAVGRLDTRKIMLLK